MLWLETQQQPQVELTAKSRLSQTPDSQGPREGSVEAAVSGNTTAGDSAGDTTRTAFHVGQAQRQPPSFWEAPGQGSGGFVTTTGFLYSIRHWGGEKLAVFLFGLN